MDIKQKASIFAILSAAMIAIGKFIAGLASGSMALIASALDSMLDVFMSSMNLFAIRIASMPADVNHQYGHGRIEDLTAIGQSLVVGGSSIIIVYKTVERFLQGATIKYTGLEILVMAISLLLSIMVSMVLKRVGERTDSNALIADALHYRSDIYSNLGVILAIILTYKTQMVVFDLVFAAIAAILILISVIKIMKGGITGLMDVSLPARIQMDIERLIKAMPLPFAGYHHFRSRISGGNKYIDFHLLVCRKASIDEAHRVAEEVERNIKRYTKRVDIITHIEPCEYPCDMTDETCVVKKGKNQNKDFYLRDNAG